MRVARCYTYPMKTNGNDKALESYKIFPYVAWILIIGFAFFVYNLTVEVRAAATEIGSRSHSVETKVNTRINEIEDFEN